MPRPERASDPLRTAVAAQGVELASIFFVVFENTLLPGSPPRRPRLLAPPGQSTGGGKLARQHLVLEPEGDEGTAVVVGWVDGPSGWAQLRSFRAVDAAYYQRFGQHLDLRPGPYAQLLREAARFFREQGFAVEVREHGPEHGAGQSDRRPWLVFALILAAALVVGIGLGALLVVMRMG